MAVDSPWHPPGPREALTFPITEPATALLTSSLETTG